jgi:hypothetical protein
MRVLCSVFLVLVVGGLAAQDRKADGKRHEYTPDKLPKTVQVKAGDSIVVTHPIDPAAVEDLTSSSDNKAVSVKGRAGNGVVEITITSAVKGKAKVGWQITQINGRVDGRKELEVEFE